MDIIYYLLGAIFLLLLSTGLGNIQKKIVKGNYFEVLKQLEDVLEKNNITSQEKITAKILQGAILFRLGIFENRECRFKDAIPYLNKAIKECKKIDDPILLFDAYNTLFINYYQAALIDDFMKTYELLDDLLKVIQEDHKTVYKQAYILMQICKAYKLHYQAFIEKEKDLDKQGAVLIKKVLKKAKRLGKKELILFVQIVLFDFARHMYIDEIIKYRKEALIIAEEIKNDFWKAEFLFHLGMAYSSKGELEQQLDYTKKAMLLDEKNGNKHAKVARNFSLGRYYAAKYDIATALNHFLTAIEYNEESNNSEISRHCYRSAGEAYEAMGQLDKALEYYQKAQELFEMIVPNAISYHQSYIAYILVRKGELTKGLTVLEEMLDFYKNTIGDKQIQVRLFFFIKDIYWYKGELDKAIDYTQKSLELSKERGEENVTKILYSLVLLTKEAGQLALAEGYLMERKVLAKKLGIKIIDLENKFLEAILLKESTNTRDWLKAELMLEELLLSELHYFLKVDVLINLCELLTKEASTFNDLTAFKKTSRYIVELHEFAVTNEIPILTVESLWLQAKLALFNFEVEKPQTLITKALEIATEKGLERLKIQLLEEQKNIDAIITQLINKGKEAISLSGRMEIIGIENTFKEVKKQRILNPREEEPILNKKMFVFKL